MDDGIYYFSSYRAERDVMSWENILKDVEFYATRRIEELERELSGIKDKELQRIIRQQIKYWKGILAKEVIP